MSRTLTISTDLYLHLEAIAHRQGLASIEATLALWSAREEHLAQRHAAVREIDALRERLHATYGEMPDSTPLIRDDRDR